MDSRVTATEEEQAPWLLRQGHMLQMGLEPEVCGLGQHDNIARQQAGYYYIKLQHHFLKYLRHDHMQAVFHSVCGGPAYCISQLPIPNSSGTRWPPYKVVWNCPSVCCLAKPHQSDLAPLPKVMVTLPSRANWCRYWCDGLLQLWGHQGIRRWWRRRRRSQVWFQ